MAAGSAVAGDIPGKFDVVINGFGYQLLDTLEPSIPFRTHRAIYSYTPTFLDRSNVSGAWGDNQQDFFFTVAQGDWSSGEGQRFLRTTDQSSISRYWDGSGINTIVPGQVTVQTDFATTITPSFGATAVVDCGVFLDGKLAWCDSNGHLNVTTSGGGVTDEGAHGAGTVDRWGMACDPNHVYIAGSTAIRKWNASAFSTFATVADAGSLAFLNNILYSCDGATLRSYDTAGTATVEFQWKDAVGTVVTPSSTGIGAKIIPYGGKLLIFLRRGQAGRPELWVFDGSGCDMVGQFPDSSIGYDVTVINGVVYLSGSVLDTNASGTITSQPIVWYYLNGTLDELWRSQVASASSSIGDAMIWPALGSYQGRLIFDDETQNQLMQYDPVTGSFSSLGTYSTTGATQATDYKMIGSDRSFFGLFFTSVTTFQLVPASDGKLASSGYLITSLVDFDNSLTKVFRGVKVEWTGTGSVDIYYQLGSVDGSWTLLQSGATSGTEYNFADNTTGVSVALKFVLNTTSPNTTGPVLKRWYLRAAPIQQAFNERAYILDLSGVGFKDPVQLNDGTYHPLSGHEQASNLITAITSTAPISVSDRFATFQAVCDPANCEIYEVREGNDSPQFSGGFVAKMTVRQV